MAFALLDLPLEVLRLVYGFVDGGEDRRALRLVCKQSCALVDNAVVAVTSALAVDSAHTGVLGLDHARLSALAHAPWHLAKLDLEYHPHPYGYIEIREDGAAILAEANWPGLKVLSLKNHNLSAESVASLCAGLGTSGLVSLDLGNNSLHDKGVASLTNWPCLESLSLRFCGLGAAGVASLAAAAFSRLVSLNIASNHVSDAGAASLAAARWPALQRLELGGTNLGDSGVAALAAAAWPDLRELDLSDNTWGTRGAAALAVAAWPGLESLNLGRNPGLNAATWMRTT